MNRTEEVETLKKELFKIEFSLKTQSHTSEEYKKMITLKKEKMMQLDYLSKELENANGQIGFAFIEQIDLNENKKGR